MEQTIISLVTDPLVVLELCSLGLAIVYLTKQIIATDDILPDREIGALRTRRTLAEQMTLGVSSIIGVGALISEPKQSLRRQRV